MTASPRTRPRLAGISRPAGPARIQGAAFAAAGVGIIVQIIAGVNYPTVPPGLVIVLVAAALILFVPWRWMPVPGVLAAVFLFIGGVATPDSRHHLTDPGHPGAFGGTLIEMAALAVAVIAGILALTVRGRRSAAA